MISGPVATISQTSAFQITWVSMRMGLACGLVTGEEEPIVCVSPHRTIDESCLREFPIGKRYSLSLYTYMCLVR